MDPAALMSSFTGTLAVFMVFFIPIIAIVAIMAVILTALRRRHKERMKMIEQGLMPPAPQRSGNYYPLLITGAIFFAFGLGMTILGLAGQSSEFEPGAIFGSIGLGMLICFIVIRVLNRKKRARLEEPPTHRPPAEPL